MCAEPNKLDWKEACVREMTSLLDGLLNAPALRFDGTLRSKLPEKSIYAISVVAAAPGKILRAGTTKTAVGGLRQRIYQNHFMGDQNGNLRKQLAQDNVCDFELTKQWIRDNCRVQFLVIEDRETRIWTEHFMLAMLKPKYCD